MDQQGRAFEYGRELVEVSWKNGVIRIVLCDKTFVYPFVTNVEPSSIQFLEDNLLITLTKRQMVAIISPKGEILWSFGEDCVPGEGYRLCVPMFSEYIKQTNTVLITDTLNSRILEIDCHGEIIWQYGRSWDPLKVCYGNHAALEGFHVEIQLSRILKTKGS
ncbi:MAG: hypothetical protein H0Z34_14625 [Brevibacillus sp.]|nr:hypothetical protein [Brevibacillus sp.]